MEKGRLHLQLLGRLAVHGDGEPLPAPRLSKGLWLLAILALRGGQEVSRDWLAGMLWPDSVEPLATLRRTLTDLRRSLGPASALLLAPTVQTLRLNVKECEIDVLKFDALAGQASLEALEQAIELYRGPLLEGCTLPSVLHERAVRQARFLEVLEQVARLYQHRKEGRKAALCLRRAIETDPYRESLYRALMQVLAEEGESAEAILVYRDLRLWMRRELNSEPATETTSLYQQIRALPQRKPRLGSSAQKPTAPASKHPRYQIIPRPLTDLIGREAELEAIETSLLQSRLVTLTGVGGIGKTHLAIQTAWNSESHFAEGVVFLELAALSDPERVLPTLATLLGVREESECPLLSVLKEALHTREVLLVLDNCEHLVQTCAHLAGALLKACPQLHILATSRQALGLTGEIIRRIPPLALPPPCTQTLTPEEVACFVARYPAIRLFVERASAVLPSFAVTPQNLTTLQQLCLALEGIPLALELAAARVNVLSVEQILARVADRFGLLSQSNRVALPHQQTLRTMLDWSYDLLSAKEQSLLSRLSIFARGWTLEAAEAVCADDADRAETTACVPLRTSEVLDLITQLMEKSLVLAEEEVGGTRRYRFLETVREYASEKLAQGGEQVYRKHAHQDYFRTLLQQLYAERHGPGQQPYLQTIEREYDNIRAALRYCQSDDESGENGLWLAGYLQDFWWIRGYLQEGRGFLEAALQHRGAQPPTSARAFALNGAGVLAWIQGNIEKAVFFLEESLAIRRAIGDRSGMASVLGNLGSVFREREDYAQSRACQEESLVVFREMNLRWNTASTLTNLGSAALLQRDHAYARECYEEAIALRRELNDQRGIAISLCGLGQVFTDLNDWQQGLCCYEESLALLREINERTNINILLLSIGRLQRDQGDYARANQAFFEALEICRETGDALTGTALYELALLSHCRQESVLAATLLGACDAYSQQSTTAFTVEEQQKREKVRGELRTHLGETTYHTAWAEGAKLSLTEVLALRKGQP